MPNRVGDDIAREHGGGRKTPEIDEEQVKELHAKIGVLAVASSFLERKLKPWGGN